MYHGESKDISQIPHVNPNLINGVCFHQVDLSWLRIFVREQAQAAAALGKGPLAGKANPEKAMLEEEKKWLKRGNEHNLADNEAKKSYRQQEGNRDMSCTGQRCIWKSILIGKNYFKN